MSDEPTVTNNANRSRFEIHVGEKLAGFAQYAPGDGIRDFNHTVIHDGFEGQGIGGKLARAALDATRAEGLKVIPTCPFIKGWIEKHPDYADLVVVA